MKIAPTADSRVIGGDIAASSCLPRFAAEAALAGTTRG